MKSVFLLMGSNLGDSCMIMEKAALAIENKLGEIVRRSGFYRSAAWGYDSSAVYFNQCIEIKTTFGPGEVLEGILNIEKEMGRVRSVTGYSDRLIDIDILFYDREIISSENLLVPHPRLHLRKFALVPMGEIAPGFIHPVLLKSIKELADSCKDTSGVFFDHR